MIKKYANVECVYFMCICAFVLVWNRDGWANEGQHSGAQGGHESPENGTNLRRSRAGPRRGSDR